METTPSPLPPNSSPAAIVGLGNPGERYAATRHNLGFMVVREFVARHRIADRKANPLALLHRARFEERDLFLLKPRTYMNLSGEAVHWLATSRSLRPEQIMVVLDDFSLPLGRLRVRAGGSSGGHNGLKDINAKLGTTDYPRLRMGIGPVPDGQDPADFVLEDFTPDEQEQVAGMLSRACDCLEVWLGQGVEAAASGFNGAVAVAKETPSEGEEEPS
ncbi:MAG: aminoacyl-tRNA hydrolase [Candidatus Eremiobacteraeota bacterium]|nr:aminoacyl-tRNA hydrolase [Candidatus Eremiobacteraeota bacterium]